MIRKVCVVTGARSDYGLLYWLMKEILDDPDLELQIIATGMHLSPEFGLTYKQIEKDGFKINEMVDIQLSSDSTVGIAKSMGVATIGLADAFHNLKPDITVLLGDRFEMFSAAQSAMVARIPIAHIHGGETTEGIIDEAIRHAITKMSHLHFVAAEAYRNRVIQMGESPDKVFNFGAPGIDNIKRLKLLGKAELEEKLGITFTRETFMVTYHPVTLSSSGAQQPLLNLFKALDEYPDAKIIFTQPNADTEGRVITEMIKNYISSRVGNAYLFDTMGQVNYLSSLQYVDLVVGNSSSGIIEAPSFALPTINIGMRQQGRLKAESIIDCKDDFNSIKAAIKKGLSKGFKNDIGDMVSPYGDGTASVKIKNELKTIDIDGIIIKKFNDIGI